MDAPIRPVRVLLALTPLWGLVAFATGGCVFGRPVLLDVLLRYAIGGVALAGGLGIFLVLRRRADRAAWSEARIYRFGAAAILLAYAGSFLIGLTLSLQTTLCAP